MAARSIEMFLTAKFSIPSGTPLNSHSMSTVATERESGVRAHPTRSDGDAIFREGHEGTAWLPVDTGGVHNLAAVVEPVAERPGEFRASPPKTASPSDTSSGRRGGRRADCDLRPARTGRAALAAAGSRRCRVANGNLRTFGNMKLPVSASTGSRKSCDCVDTNGGHRERDARLFLRIGGPHGDRLTEHPGPRGVTGRISLDDCRPAPSAFSATSSS